MGEVRIVNGVLAVRTEVFYRKTLALQIFDQFFFIVEPRMIASNGDGEEEVERTMYHDLVISN
jgi:hypothetical protein